MREGVRNAAIIGGLGVAWLLAVAFVGTHGEFPLNDDWAYTRAVETWMKTGRIERSGWTFAPVITNIWIGGAFQTIFGQTFEALRWSNVVFGFAGVAGAYALVREMGAGRIGAAVAAACVAANPIYFNLSLTFMTDPAWVAFCTWSMWGLSRTLGGRGLAGAVFGSLCAVGAIASRQPAVIIPIGFAAALFVAQVRRPRAWLIGAAATIVLAAACALASSLTGWFDSTPMRSFETFFTRMMFTPHSEHHVIRAGLCDVVYIGAFLSPLVVATALSRRANLAASAVALLTVAGIALLKRHLPVGLNMIWDFGLGPLDASARLPRLPQSAWWTLTVLGAICGGRVVVLLAQRVRAIVAELRNSTGAPWLRRESFLLITTLVYLAAMLFGRAAFDRYQVFALAPLAALVAPWAQWTAPRRLAAATCLAILAGFAVLGTRDYLEHNRARWALIDELLARNVSVRSIDGGFEFNGYYNFSWDQKSFAKDADRWVHDDEYVVTVDADRRGYDVIASREYTRLLPPGNWRMVVLRRTAR